MEAVSLRLKLLELLHHRELQFSATEILSDREEVRLNALKFSPRLVDLGVKAPDLSGTLQQYSHVPADWIAVRLHAPFFVCCRDFFDAPQELVLCHQQVSLGTLLRRLRHEDLVAKFPGVFLEATSPLRTASSQSRAIACVFSSDVFSSSRASTAFNLTSQSSTWPVSLAISRAIA
eukprot:CAMPEP_0117533242 /NCGR_PEP_ID=MMETSP0784-20121206/39788_1 /TAXON_ID=39447 /ORGANISM="" /LENGTH=175 /DNA_ID=CAMNT_0005329671 /DNA_START=168 /DNA_END=692 /DNA_ORIENTATION=-